MNTRQAQGLRLWLCPRSRRCTQASGSASRVCVVGALSETAETVGGLFSSFIGDKLTTLCLRGVEASIDMSLTCKRRPIVEVEVQSWAILQSEPCSNQNRFRLFLFLFGSFWWSTTP